MCRKKFSLNLKIFWTLFWQFITSALLIRALVICLIVFCLHLWWSTKILTFMFSECEQKSMVKMSYIAFQSFILFEMQVVNLLSSMIFTVYIVGSEYLSHINTYFLRKYSQYIHNVIFVFYKYPLCFVYEYILICAHLCVCVSCE